MPSSNAFPPLSLPAVPKHPMVWHFPVREDLLPFLLGKRLRKAFLVHRAHLRLLLGETTALFFTVAGPFCSLTNTVKNSRVSPSPQGSCSESFPLVMILTRLP